MKYTGKTQEYLEISPISNLNCNLLKESASNELSLLWILADECTLKVDNKIHQLSKNDIVCLTEFNKVKVVGDIRANLLRWNKHFYCVINHDSEVGCRGILFYGASELPIIKLHSEGLEMFSNVWKVMQQEMRSNDSLQEEMLQMMLKRILVLCTRMYKKQHTSTALQGEHVELIRAYNFLVEQHFKEKHTVKEYADLLHKSPKTLSNMFKKLGLKSPSQFIKDRKMLEARRLLIYTNKSISDIGYELGFPDVQSFSRFFKSHEGLSPQIFKLGNIDKS